MPPEKQKTLRIETAYCIMNGAMFNKEAAIDKVCAHYARPDVLELRVREG